MARKAVTPENHFTFVQPTYIPSAPDLQDCELCGKHVPGVWDVHMTLQHPQTRVRVIDNRKKKKKK